MKILVAEDDFTSRLVIQKLLEPFGDVHAAVDGREALEAFQAAHDSSEPYDLVCLDIMMPELDGQAVLKEIRRVEEAAELSGLKGVKVIMTTALDDGKNVMAAFRAQCEAYLVKPIDKAKLIQHLRELKLIENE
jgi:two-component system, chemotaxis family, chemotaxis protein CheY